MIQFDTEVIDVIRRTHNVKSFRFKRTKEADFKAGQFFFVTIEVNGEERTKHFSFSSSPTESKYIEFTKKITGSDYSKALDMIKVGDWARIKMPKGSFTFDGEYERIAFLSGGIGITPIRSICRYVIDRKIGTDMVLLYGNRSEEDIVFKADFDRMQDEYPGLKVVHVLCEEPLNCQAKKGFINKDIIEDAVMDYEKRQFYVCGPPKMVEAMNGILKDQLSLTEDTIITENFTGY